MVSHIHYNLNANEDFVIPFTSKFITCYIQLHAFGFTSGIKSQLIVYLLRGSEQMTWALAPFIMSGFRFKCKRLEF